MKLPPPLVLLLAVALLVDALAAGAVQPAGGPTPRLFLMVSLCFSQTQLLAIWVALGVAHWLWRWLGLVAGIVFWTWLWSQGLQHPGPARVGTLLSCLALLLVVCVFPWRWRGYRWLSRRDAETWSARPHAPRFQFSLAFLLQITTLVAVLVLLARWAVPDDADEILLMALAYVLLGSVAIWAFSTSRGGPLRIAAVPAAAVVGSLPMLLQDEQFWMYLVLHLTIAVQLLIALALCRWVGVKIERVGASAPSDENDSPEAAPPDAQ